MFGLFEKKKLEVFTPCEGEVILLKDVNDEVFSKKMAGEGVAIVPKDSMICAPIDGIITKIFPTNHAFMITDRNTEVIVHIGLDTVALEGEGFYRLASEEQSVKAGDPIIEVDLEFLKSKGIDTTTPVIVSSGEKVVNEFTGNLEKNQVIMEINL
ncbi:MAG: PTS glucose transporter subunit IIA [Campylobacterales bacterium]|nr:PTS glucose transporter subunit IIA [Campylobacterales bacterium]